MRSLVAERSRRLVPNSNESSKDQFLDVVPLHLREGIHLCLRFIKSLSTYTGYHRCRDLRSLLSVLRPYYVFLADTTSLDPR